MDAHEALITIIARCPDLLHEATKALVARRADSPIADRRVAHVAAAALAQYGEAFSPDERAGLAALIAPATDGEEDTRSVLFPIRVTPTERERIHEDAAARGQTASDYVRARLNLPTRLGASDRV